MDLNDLSYWFLSGLTVASYAYIVYLWALEIRNGIVSLGGKK